MTEGEALSLRYVCDAIASLPTQLARALECPLPRLARAPRSVITTGVGASEGPARLLSAVLAEAGLAARFCPVTRFLASSAQGAVPLPTADLLVAFSQGLSPNGRLALGREHAFGARWLVTSLDAATASDKKGAALQTLRARGVTTIVVPPADEPEALVRFVGPTVAALTALRLGALLSADRALTMRLAEAPAAYAAPPTTVQLEGPLALVTAGALAESAYAQRWKLLETLLTQDPPVWDALQFAHGPLQAFHGQRLTLLVLEGAGEALLVERLVRTLEPARHTVLRIVASQPAPLSFFQHTAQIDALLLATLSQAPRDLFNWPRQNADAPLYELGDDT